MFLGEELPIPFSDGPVNDLLSGGFYKFKIRVLEAYMTKWTGLPETTTQIQFLDLHSFRTY